MQPNDGGPRKMRRHNQGKTNPVRQPKPQRWRVTMVAGPGQHKADEPRMERMVADLITIDSSPHAVAEYVFSPWLSDGFLVIASVEPITETTAYRLGDGEHGLDRDEVTAFLTSIGYFDEQETAKENRRNG